MSLQPRLEVVFLAGVVVGLVTYKVILELRAGNARNTARKRHCRLKRRPFRAIAGALGELVEWKESTRYRRQETIARET